MASSTGSLDTSANSRPNHTNSSFSFSSSFPTSFSELLMGGAGGVDYMTSDHEPGSRISMSRGVGIPKFKSLPPPSLPISPPSSYFAIPAGLSPAELLDSPVLLSPFNILPSPTTGTIPLKSHNWKPNSTQNYQQQLGIKEEEERNFSDFSFPTNNKNNSFLQSTNEAYKEENQSWNYQEPNKNSSEAASYLKRNRPEHAAAPVRTSSTELVVAPQTLREQRRSDDGYNWRKYGQKQVKGSENPRSYYKCTCPNCPTKKKVERSLDGQITEIVYKGTHNHPKPQATRKNSGSSHLVQAQAKTQPEVSDHSFNARSGTPVESVTTPDNSSVSFGDGDGDGDGISQRSNLGGVEYDEVEPEAKRIKNEVESEGIQASGNRTVREPRVVVQTTSDIDILDDGYRWRKYGQKVVKGNPNPRSYYKCTSAGCQVRKHVERASHDLRAVITTYEGKHNHDVPTARGSGINRPSAVAIRPSAVANHMNQAPMTLEMLQQAPPASYGYSSNYDNLMNSYMGHQHQQQKHMESSIYPKAKDELREDLFVDSLLC